MLSRKWSSFTIVGVGGTLVAGVFAWCQHSGGSWLATCSWTVMNNVVSDDRGASGGIMILVLHCCLIVALLFCGVVVWLWRCLRWRYICTWHQTALAGDDSSCGAGVTWSDMEWPRMHRVIGGGWAGNGSTQWCRATRLSKLVCATSATCYSTCPI